MIKKARLIYNPVSGHEQMPKKCCRYFKYR